MTLPAGFHVVTYAKIVNTPAMPFLARAWTALLDADLITSPGYCYVAWDHAAILAFDGDGNIIGTISYTHEVWASRLTVIIGYVAPAWRAHGVYRRLWQELVIIAQDKKCARIEGGTMAKNKVMRAVAESFGRREDGITLNFDVPS